MKLVITVDVEEDSWGQFQKTGCTVRNIRRIVSLQALFKEFAVIPTYLLTYPVATDPEAISILRPILNRGGCEIGAHCHPWNTPPFEEETSERNSMICNLPDGLQYEKLKSLRAAIRQSFGIDPVSFRAGRWGFSLGIAQSLVKLGYKIDTSVTPYTDWTQYCGVDYTKQSPQPYRMKWDEQISESGISGDLFEVPVSIGYLQKNFALCNRLYQAANSGPLCKLRLVGLLQKLRLLNRVFLSPESTDSRTMILLAERFMNNKYQILNMFFHSPSLQAGLSPFVKTADEEKRFLSRIREFLIFARTSGIDSISLCDAPQHLAQGFVRLASTNRSVPRLC